MHSVRFIHASDFHLDQPLGGLTHVPSKLREDFVEAPFVAAELVFDAALDEKIDFLILSGDIMDLESAGPRAIDFLYRQFERLQQQQLPVYWIGGRIDDPDLWPAELPLPKNVHSFGTGGVEQMEFKKRGRHYATIVGTSFHSTNQARVSDFSVAESNVARIAIAYGDFESRDFPRPSVDYWALGGHHNSKDVSKSNPVARYSGNPQGLNPDEDGIHGCSLVQIEHGRVHVRSIETNTIRWKTERLQLSADANRSDIVDAIGNRINSFGLGQKGPLCLVRWLVTCKGDLFHELRNEKQCDKILSSLANSEDAITVAIEPEYEEISTDHFGEDTILGDFLRSVREYENDPNRMLDLLALLPDSFDNRDLVSHIRFLNNEDRNRILRRVAALGVELLRGDSASTSS